MLDIFDILGPVMIGPSSSHTAGAARIGAMARTLLGAPPVKAAIHLYGSFAETGAGHGTDRALVGGLLGMKPDDPRLPFAFDAAEKAGLTFTIDEVSLREAHPNTAVIEAWDSEGKKLTMQASSLGGGRISYYLAKMIVPMGMHVAMIEINPKKAESLSESLPHVNVILGDGTDQELLEQEGLESMDAFIAMCDRDEENLMTGLFAVKQGVPKVIVKNNRLAYADIMNGMGLDSMVSPKTITCSTILRYVRALVNSDGTKVERLYRLMNGRVEALEFIARASDPYIGIPLKNLHIRKNALVAVIARQGKVIVPFGDDKIEEGDHVVIIVCENGIGDLNEVISK